MNTYIITVSEGRRHRREVRRARSLSQAFNDAINFYGKACVSCVKPWRSQQHKAFTPWPISA